MPFLVTGRRRYGRAFALIPALFLCSLSMAQGLIDQVRATERLRETQIVEARSLDSTCISVEEWSTDGGAAVGYFKPDGKLSIAFCWLHGETGKRFRSFHFADDELAYSILLDSRYNRPYYWDEAERKENNDTEVFDPAKTTTTSTAYFFENGAPLCWEAVNGTSVEEDMIAGSDTSLLSQAVSLRSMLLDARKNGEADCAYLDWRKELREMPDRCGMTLPDTALANVALEDASSAIEVLGSIPSNGLVEDNTDFPHVGFRSSDGSQYMTFFIYYGDGPDNYAAMRLSRTRPTNVRDTLPSVNFRSGNGVTLGMSKADVIAKLGKCYSIYYGERGHELLSYSIKDHVRSDFLRRYNMPSYFAILEFELDKLTDYRFGFDYP